MTRACGDLFFTFRTPVNILNPFLIHYGGALDILALSEAGNLKADLAVSLNR